MGIVHLCLKLLSLGYNLALTLRGFSKWLMQHWYIMHHNDYKEMHGEQEMLGKKHGSQGKPSHLLGEKNPRLISSICHIRHRKYTGV